MFTQLVPIFCLFKMFLFCVHFFPFCFKTQKNTGKIFFHIWNKWFYFLINLDFSVNFYVISHATFGPNCFLFSFSFPRKCALFFLPFSSLFFFRCFFCSQNFLAKKTKFWQKPGELLECQEKLKENEMIQNRKLPLIWWG